MVTGFCRDPGLQLDRDNGARLFPMEQSTGDDVAGNGRSVLTLTPISGFFLSTMIFGGAVTVDVVRACRLSYVGDPLILRAKNSDFQSFRDRFSEIGTFSAPC
jgi:hypothetical protein